MKTLRQHLTGLGLINPRNTYRGVPADKLREMGYEAAAKAAEERQHPSQAHTWMDRNTFRGLLV